MRLFTAILFEDGIKDYLCEINERLRQVTTTGSFTARDNLHLTLNFIGETARVEEVKQAMIQAVNNIGAGKFEIKLGGFGRFKRREGDICFVGVDKDKSLWSLQRELVRRLKEEGFSVDDLEYKPHLTLARRAAFAERFEDKTFAGSFRSVNMDVTKISLMKSERLQGKLVYTEIDSVYLN